MRQDLRQEFLQRGRCGDCRRNRASARPRRFPLVHEITRCATFAGKTHLWIRPSWSALAGEIDHESSTSEIISGSRRRGRLVVQHGDRIHRQRPRDGDALLLPPDNSAGYLRAWSFRPTRLSSFDPFAIARRGTAQDLLLRQAKFSMIFRAEIARNAGTPCRSGAAVSADRSWDR